MNNNQGIFPNSFAVLIKTVVLPIACCFGLVSQVLAVEAEPVIKKQIFQCGSDKEGHALVGAGSAGEHKNKDGYPAAIFTRDKNNSYTLFESGPVRPLALSDDKKLLFVTNLPANCLEIYNVSGITDSDSGTDAKMLLESTVTVGVDPVSVAVRTANEVWVVNHVSDSISIIKWLNDEDEDEVDENVAPHVAETLQVGDEPRDIVFADSGADSGTDTTGSINARDRVFITTAARGQHDASFSSMDFFNAPDANAVEGTSGLARVWVFDAASPTSALTKLTLFTSSSRALAVGDNGATVYAAGFLSGNTSVTVGADDTAAAKRGVTHTETGQKLQQDNAIIRKDKDGQYRDETMLNERTDDDSGIDWSDAGENITDRDVFKINVSDYSIQSVTGVGTSLFNMVVDGSDVLVSNTDARNHIRFVDEGAPNQLPGEKLKGHIVEHNITRVPAATWGDQANNPVEIKNLNDYIEDFSAPNQPQSLAQPVDMAINGSKLYVAAYGSHKIGVMDLSDDSMIYNEYIDLSDFSSRDPGVGGGGPAGLAIAGNTLFVYSRFDNAVRAIDLVGEHEELDEVEMNTPESELVVNGRPFLYDATITSGNGTAACGSCHVYGDFDLLAWDLGNLKGGVHGTNTLPMSFKNPLGGDITNLINVQDFENNSDWVLGGGYFPETTGLEVDGPITVLGELTGTLKADSAGSDIYSEAGYVKQQMDNASSNEDDYTPENSDQVYLVNEDAVGFLELNTYKALPVDPAAFSALSTGWGPNEYVCIDAVDSDVVPDGIRESLSVPDPVEHTCPKYRYQCVASGKDPTEPFVVGSGMECAEGRTLEQLAPLSGATYAAYRTRWCVDGSSCSETPLIARVAGVPQHEVIILRSGGSSPQLLEFVGGAQLVRFSHFKTGKGVMVTQTLRGIADSGAMHWRGDKTGCRNDAGDDNAPKCIEPLANGEAQEERAFKEFNEAFVNLLGKGNLCAPNSCTEGLTETQMQAFTDFTMQIAMPPSPVRKLDDSLTEHQEMGLNLFMGQPQSGLLPPLDGHSITTGRLNAKTSCNSCHLLDEKKNLFGTDKSLLGLGFPLKVPQLRNMYQKVGRFISHLGAIEKEPGGAKGTISGDVQVFSGALQTWRLTAVSATEFTVKTLNQDGSESTDVYSPAEVGTEYSNAYIKFTLAAGAEAFVAGDEFVFTTREAPANINGVGYLHGGDPASLDLFAIVLFRTLQPDGSEGQLAMNASQAIGDFLMAFPSNLKPVVGQQVTIMPTDFDGYGVLGTAKRAQLDVLVKQAAIGNCDLVVDAVAYEDDEAHAVQLVGERWRNPASCTSTPMTGDDICLVSTDTENPVHLTDESMLAQIATPSSGFLENGVTATCRAPGSIGQVVYHVGLGDDPEDFDDDGEPNVTDTYPTNPAASEDTDGDGYPDAWLPSCDATCQTGSGLTLDAFPGDPGKWADTDHDGIDDGVDNCVFIANSDQLDADKDGQGDVCDTDDDNDGLEDLSDNCPLVPNPLQKDMDADSHGNACDYDVDNDEDVDSADWQLIIKEQGQYIGFGSTASARFTVPVIDRASEFDQSLMYWKP